MAALIASATVIWISSQLSGLEVFPVLCCQYSTFFPWLGPRAPTFTDKVPFFTSLASLTRTAVSLSLSLSLLACPCFTTACAIIAYYCVDNWARVRMRQRTFTARAGETESRKKGERKRDPTTGLQEDKARQLRLLRILIRSSLQLHGQW